MMRSRAVPHPGFNFEYVMFLFTRISGLALVVLGIAGAVGALIMGARQQMDLNALLRWSYFPNPNHVINSNIPDLAQGWISLWWQSLEMVMVFFGATHGMNGLRNVIEDYVSTGALQTILRVVVAALWIFILVAGVMIILTN